jgi:signal transduction histidine kinase
MPDESDDFVTHRLDEVRRPACHQVVADSRSNTGGAAARRRTHADLRSDHLAHRGGAAQRAGRAGERSQVEFLASMSHELRTPMNAIIGFTRLVMRRSKEVLPAQQYGNLEKILASANHLLALLNDVLDLSDQASRMEGG